MGPDGIAASDHPLQDPMGVGLHDGSIHEGARVALIGIADHIFGLPWSLTSEAPFEASGETRTAPTTQFGLGHFGDDLLWIHLAQNLAQGAIATQCDVVGYRSGVYLAIHVQEERLLFLIEGYIALIDDFLTGVGIYV